MPFSVRKISVMIAVLAALVAGIRILPDAAEHAATSLGHYFLFVPVVLGALTVALLEYYFKFLGRWAKAVVGALHYGRIKPWVRLTSLTVVALLVLFVYITAEMASKGTDMRQLRERTPLTEDGVRLVADVPSAHNTRDTVMRTADPDGRQTITVSYGDGRSPRTIRPAIARHSAELFEDFPPDPAPRIVDVQVWPVLPSTSRPAIIAVLAHRNGLVSEVAAFDIDGTQLDAPAVWNVGRLFGARIVSVGNEPPALFVLGESVPAAWVLDALNGFDRNWVVEKNIARYTTALVQVPATARGLIGPLPARDGVVAQGIRSWYRVPSAQEIDGLLVRVSFAPLASSPLTELSLSGEVEAIATNGPQTVPVPVPVFASGMPIDTCRAPTHLSIRFSRIELVEFDTAFAQRVAGELLDDMHYLPADAARKKFVYVHQGRFTPPEMVAALVIIDRMTSSPAVINNLAVTLTRSGPPCPRVCESLSATLSGMLSNGKIPFTLRPRVLNTLGNLAAAVGDFMGAVPFLEESLRGGDEETIVDSSSLLVVCAAHLANDDLKTKHSAQVRSAIARTRAQDQSMSSQWLGHAANLLDARAHAIERVDSPRSPDDPVECPASRRAGLTRG